MDFEFEEHPPRLASVYLKERRAAVGPIVLPRPKPLIHRAKSLRSTPLEIRTFPEVIALGDEEKIGRLRIFYEDRGETPARRVWVKVLVADMKTAAHLRSRPNRIGPNIAYIVTNSQPNR